MSVIISTYNRPRWLAEAIESVLGQTWQDFELIVVNDGGHDVGEIVRDVKDERVSYLSHAHNLGSNAALNTALGAARGKYIAYLDDDDIYYGDHLAVLVGYLEAHPEVYVAYTDAVFVDLERQGDKYTEIGRNIRYSHDFDRQKLLIANFIPLPCLVHRRDCLERAGSFDSTLRRLGDWEFFLRLSRHFDFDHIKRDTCEVRWRTDGTTSTSSGPIAHFTAYLAIMRRNLDFLDQDAATNARADLRRRFREFYETLLEGVLFDRLDPLGLSAPEDVRATIDQAQALKAQFDPEFSVEFSRLLALLYAAQQDSQGYSQTSAMLTELERAEAAEQDLAVQALAASVEQNQAALKALLQQHTKQAEVLKAASAQLAERQQALQAVSAQLAERQQALQAVSAEVSKTQQAFQAVSAQLAAKDLQVNDLSNTLKRIQESRTWKTAQRLARVYRWFWPRRLDPDEH